MGGMEFEMRLIEIIYAILSLSLLWWSIFSTRQNRKGILVQIEVLLLLVILHWKMEGIRWQMAPLYSVPLLIVFFSWLNILKKWLKIIIVIICLLFTIIAITIPLILPVFTFKEPSGKYAVGTTSYTLVDQNRSESYEKNLNIKRKLAIQVWYPANKNEKGELVPYLSNIHPIASGLNKALKMPPFLFQQLSLVKAHSMDNLHISSDKPNYPVLIFSHGLTGFRNQNTFEVEELASHGYIVVGIDHTYDAAATIFEDGSSAEIRFKNLSGFEVLDSHISIWEKDVSFVLNQLKKMNKKDKKHLLTNRLNLDQIGMFGHSYGGATAVQMLMKDNRIKAAVNMDGTLYGDKVKKQGIKKPLMIFNGEKSIDYKSYKKTLKQADTKLKKPLSYYENNWKETTERRENAVANGGISIEIPHTSHMSFTDFPLFSPFFANKGEDPRHVHNVINAYTLNFFDAHLKNQPFRLNELMKEYSDIKVNISD